MALYFFCFSTPQGRMAFASFFSFSSACPTRFATLLSKRSQTMLFASPNFLSSVGMLDMLQSSLIKRHGWLEDFWNQAHKWALTRHVGSKWAGLQGCHVHLTGRMCMLIHAMDLWSNFFAPSIMSYESYVKSSLSSFCSFVPLFLVAKGFRCYLANFLKIRISMN